MTLKTTHENGNDGSIIIKLNLEESFKEIKKLNFLRLEDFIMCQAFDIYCSLISPPTSPRLSRNDHLTSHPNGGHFSARRNDDELELIDEEPETETDLQGDDQVKINQDSKKQEEKEKMLKKIEELELEENKYNNIDHFNVDDFVNDDDPFASYPILNSNLNLNLMPNNNTRTHKKHILSILNKQQQHNLNLNVQSNLNSVKPSTRKRTFSVSSIAKNRKLILSSSSSISSTSSSSFSSSSSSSTNSIGLRISNPTLNFNTFSSSNSNHKNLNKNLKIDENEDISTLKYPLLCQSKSTSNKKFI